MNDVIDEKRDVLESLAEKDLPASELAGALLEVAEGSE
ncbi:hypothetical protein SAMN05421809_3038 [Natronorubrum daqingense]|uniref:Uncharacterized protein n=1 Tax=Natronorubrum daqingense TaxID=588898 RepID=A0A1N7F5X4_9EURY|nr:hypothetical protein SAMN05421809_3038 [Natronorubrum daqingense]